MIPCSIRAWIKSLHRLFICCSCFLEFEYWTKCFNNCNFDFFVSDKSRVLTLLALDLILSHGQLPFLESKQCLIFLQIFLPIFSDKMKSELQPTRATFARKFHCKKRHLLAEQVFFSVLRYWDTAYRDGSSPSCLRPCRAGTQCKSVGAPAQDTGENKVYFVSQIWEVLTCDGLLQVCLKQTSRKGIRRVKRSQTSTIFT